MIDEDIRAALDVDPSPEFVARVRTRIATEEAPSAWRWSWGVAIASALVASAVLVVFVSRQQTRPSTSVAGTAVAASDNRPASDAPTLERNDSVPRSEASGRRSKTVARQGGAVSRQARSLATETNALTMRTERSEPEILIDPREASALLQLITGVRDGRIDLRAAQTIASPAPAEVEPVAAIVIAPITIEPIAPMLGAEGGTPVMKQFETLALVVAFGLGSTALVRTQEKPAPPPPPKAASPSVAAPALKVQVVIGRYQGEKKLSSMPYTLTINAGGHANLRMGTRIPISMMPSANAPKDAPSGLPFQYQDVGTNIDCSAAEVEGGRFSLVVSIDDSSVYPDDAATSAKGNPSFRSFRASNSMVLKNGETGQFMSATDKLTGETVRVDVTLTVMR